jgi:hypothetical protein
VPCIGEATGPADGASKKKQTPALPARARLHRERDASALEPRTRKQSSSLTHAGSLFKFVAQLPASRGACRRSPRRYRLVRSSRARAADCAGGKGVAGCPVSTHHRRQRVSHGRAQERPVPRSAARPLKRTNIEPDRASRPRARPRRRRADSASRHSRLAARRVTGHSRRSNALPNYSRLAAPGESGSSTGRLAVGHGTAFVAAGERRTAEPSSRRISRVSRVSRARTALSAESAAIGASATPASFICAPRGTSELWASARLGNRRIDSRTSGFGKRAAKSSSTWRRLLPLHSSNSSAAFP